MLFNLEHLPPFLYFFQLIYSITYVSGVQHSDSQFLKVFKTPFIVITSIGCIPCAM